MFNNGKSLAQVLLVLICLAMDTVPVVAAQQSTAASPTDVAGVWQGTLQVDANTSLQIRFTFTRKPDGAWLVTLSSPDGGAIKNVPADTVAVSNGTVKVGVAALSGSFSGTVSDRKIEGQWTQPGGAIPLVLSPYEKPQLSQAAVQMLVGGWHGTLRVPGGALTFIARFRQDNKGELQGGWGVLEQGGAQVPLHDIEFVNNALSFKGPSGGQFDGIYGNGAFIGAWKTAGAPPNGIPLKLEKGDLAPPVYPLHLKASAVAALSGDWEGTLQVMSARDQPVSLQIVLHFGTDQNGDTIGSLDSPTQHVSGIAITEATLDSGKVTLIVAGVKAEFHGDLSGGTLTGQWLQGPVSTPLVLKRK